MTEPTTPTAVRVLPALAGGAIVVLCVSTAIALAKPRWWLGAGLAAGLGLQANNLMALLLPVLLAGLLATGRRGVLASRWPWLGEHSPR